MPRPKFERIPFGNARAHVVLSKAMQDAIIGVVPAEVRGRQPQPVTSHNAHEIAAGDYKCSMRPPGERVLLVSLEYEGKRICALVTPKDTLLVTLNIKNEKAFSEGHVVEGCLRKDEVSGDMVLVLTDALVVDGVYMDKVPFEMRKLVCHVFSAVQVQPHRKNGMRVEVAVDLDKSEMPRMLTLHQQILLHPRSESFASQLKRQSYMCVQ